MNHALLFALCPGIKFIGEGELSGYMLIFDGFCPDTGGAIVNLERSHDDAVCGGLFEINEEHLKVLDDDHDHPRHSSRVLFDIRRPGLLPNVKANVYFHEALVDGMPSHEYLKRMIQGARDCGLPEEYIFSSIELYGRGHEK
ncbi:MAG: gamma-glutamylcyclotransferase [Candidatus Omnitrophica bacterium]|nr:gamma-glutamylcyclotransferase [Candidatus Omnitrophota bacterium]